MIMLVVEMDQIFDILHIFGSVNCRPSNTSNLYRKFGVTNLMMQTSLPTYISQLFFGKKYQFVIKCIWEEELSFM